MVLYLPFIAGIVASASAYDTQHMDPEVCAQNGQPVLLFNPSYSLYMFVSNDKDAGDNVVEAHKYKDEPRNRFILKPARSGKYKLYNPTYGLYAFLGNGKDSRGDRLLFAHTYPDEARNEFELKPVGDGNYKLYSPSYGDYLFVSNDKSDGDNLVEGHTYGSEERNSFAFQLAIEPTISQLRWEVDSGKLLSQKPAIVFQQELTPSASGTATFNYNHALSEGSSFQYSLGYESTVKLSFSAGVPLFVQGKIEVSATLKHSWQWGTSKTETWSYSGSAQLTGTPWQQLICKAAVKTVEMEIPYTATWVTSDNKEFTTQGKWQGTTCFDLVAYADDSATWGLFVEVNSGDTMVVGFRKGIVFYKGNTTEELGRVPDSILASNVEYDLPWGHRWMSFRMDLDGMAGPWWIERYPGAKRWRRLHERSSLEYAYLDSARDGQTQHSVNASRLAMGAVPETEATHDFYHQRFI